MNSEQLHTNDLNQETGVSGRLTTLPLKQEEYTLTKQLFWDLIRIWYGCQLSRTPKFCECAIRFSLQHALSCKKEGFVSIRHNSIRDVTAIFLHKVCGDVQLSPPLHSLTGEELCERSAITTAEAHCDVSTRGFWSAGQVEFLDLRVFNPNANRYVSQSLKEICEINEKENKRAYNERVQEIEHGLSIPIVMSTTNSMARKCSKFYSHLSDMIAEKRDQPYSVIASWIWRKIHFSLSRSNSMCIWGSGSVTSSNDLLMPTANNAVAGEAISNIVLVWIYEHPPRFFFFSTWSLWLGRNSCKLIASPTRRKASYGMNKMSRKKKVILKIQSSASLSVSYKLFEK